MKKINLKEISKIMSESEMKDVKGGIDFPMVEPDDNPAIVDGGGGGGGNDEAKYTACSGSKLCDPCYYRDAQYLPHSGSCSQNAWDSRRYCSSLVCHH
jgi:hypothetical protein